SNEGVEIEFDQRVLTDQWYRQALTDYLVGGVEFGYMKNSLLAYYQDVYGLYEIYNSNNPIGKQIYNDIYYFSKGEYEYKLPETGNIKGRILNIEREPIQGAQVMCGDKVVTTDSEGNYEFDGLRAGVQNFSVEDDVYKVYNTAQFNVDIKPGYTIYKDIILEKGILYGKVGGTVDNSVYSNLSAGIIPTISMPVADNADELKREQDIMPRLTDGIYGNGDWAGQRSSYVDFYRNTGRDLYINLGETCTVKEIGFRFLRDDPSAILLPSSVDIYISNDSGKNWGLLASISANMATTIDANHGIYEYNLSGLNFQANEVKISFPVFIWAFSDELKIMGSKGVVDDAMLPPVGNAKVKAPNYSMYIDTNNDTLNVGQSAKLTVKDLNNTDADGNPIIINNVVYNSSNPDIIKVDSNGNVMALSEGSAMIYASVNGIQVESKLLTVIKPKPVATRINVDPTTVTINVGDSSKVLATVYDQNNNAMPNINVGWSSNDPTVATVDNTGKITAIAAGTTVVKATYGDLSASVNVTVKKESGVSTTLKGPNFVNVGQEYTVTFGLNNAKDITAQGLVVNYDSNVFDFVEAKSVDETKIQVLSTDTNTPGVVKIILASLGGQSALNGNTDILNITFKAKAESHSTDINIEKAELSDSQGNEVSAALTMKSISVTPEGDLNGDGKVTIADLGILAKYYGTTSSDSNWNEIKIADYDNSDKIDLYDLVFIAKKVNDNL
ncbi:MAG: Ig-like domain-containing protein, partial [Thermoanaerobacterium sp.]|nr:Ig-like domain-containing protein [Thermoanaerobacterium sp.]